MQFPFHKEFPDFDGLFHAEEIKTDTGVCYNVTLKMIDMEQKSATVETEAEVEQLLAEFSDESGDSGCAEDSMMNKYRFQDFHP